MSVSQIHLFNASEVPAVRPFHGPCGRVSGALPTAGRPGCVGVLVEGFRAGSVHEPPRSAHQPRPPVAAFCVASGIFGDAERHVARCVPRPARAVGGKWMLAPLQPAQRARR